MGVAEIKKSFHALPLEERLRLLYDLWDELSAGATGFDLSDEEQTELERRFAEHVAEPGSSMTWEEIRTMFGVVIDSSRSSTAASSS